MKTYLYFLSFVDIEDDNVVEISCEDRFIMYSQYQGC